MASQGYFFNQKTPVGLVVAQAVGITASTYLLGTALRQAPSTHTAQLTARQVRMQVSH
jgi:hypothetical protein